MAIRKGEVAIEAVWVWDWVERGVLRVAPVFGTSVLRVLGAARPRKTVVKVRKVTKKGGVTWEQKTLHMRYSLRGNFLVPRWDDLRLHLRREHLDVYSPENDVFFEVPAEELAKRGMICVNGVVYILIYMHVEDLLHLSRQQAHIRENYAKELKKMEVELRQIENRVFLLGGSVQLQRLAAMRKRYMGRQYDIASILSIAVAGREEAARSLIGLCRKGLCDAARSIRLVIQSQDLADLKNGRLSRRDNIMARLKVVYEDLSGISVRPVGGKVNLALRCLREAIARLYIGDFDIEGILRRAAQHLDAAVEMLECGLA